MNKLVRAKKSSFFIPFEINWIHSPKKKTSVVKKSLFNTSSSYISHTIYSFNAIIVLK